MSSSMTLSLLLMLKDMASGPLGNFNNHVVQTSAKLLALGESSKFAGEKIIDAMEEPLAAFSEAEDAAIRLKTAMMMKGAVVPDAFYEMNDLATQLGNKLPGETADFQRMFAVLKKQGVDSPSILNGLGSASANLAVLLGESFEGTALFAAQSSKATGIAAQDMNGFMDTIQRIYHLGVSVQNMGMFFSHSSEMLHKFGVQGKKATDSFAPIMALLMESGASGETVGTNLTAMMNTLYAFQTAATPQAKKAKAALHAMGVELDVFDKAGQLRGPKELIAQLEKLQKLAPDKRESILTKIFGGGMDKELASKLSSGGVKAYQDMMGRMNMQASLEDRIKEILNSLKNIWDAMLGTFKNLQVVFIEPIAPELKAITNYMNTLIEKAIAFTKTHPQLAKLVAGFTLLSGAALVLSGGALIGIGMLSNLLGPLETVVSFISIRFMHLFSTLLKIGAWNSSAGVKLTGWVTGLPGKITSVGTKMWSVFVGIPGRFITMFGRIGGGAKLLGTRFFSIFTKIPGFFNSIFRAIVGLPGLIGRIPALFGMITTGIQSMGAAALANPVGLIIAGIAIAAILVFKYWRPLVGFFKGLWHGLMVGLLPLKPAFQATFSVLAPMLNPVIGAIKSLWNWIKSLLHPVDDVGHGAEKMGVRMGLAIAQIITKAGELLLAFIELPAKIMNIGKNMAQGLVDGFKSVPIVGPIVGAIGAVIGGSKKEAKVHSPSRVYLWIGEMMGLGLELGMTSKTSSIMKAAAGLAKAATPKMPTLALQTAMPGMVAPNVAIPRPASRPQNEPIRTGFAAGSAASVGANGQGGMHITFAPVIQLQPGAMREQVTQAMALSYQEFERMMRQYDHDKERISW